MITELPLKEKNYNNLPIYLNTAGIGHTQERRMRPEGSPFHHIFFIEEGEGVFETPEGRYILSANTAVFIKKNYPHTYFANNSRFITSWIMFEGSMVENLLEYFSAKPFSFRQNSNIFSKIVSCKNLLTRAAPPEILSAEAYSTAIAYFHELNNSNNSPYILKAKEFIQKNYSHDISVDSIARSAGISQSLLFRLFKEKEKRTPIAYLRDVRIQSAKQLLISNSDLSIGDISEACGFSDFAYFCKVFKSVTGSTPTHYRSTYGI